MLNKFWAAAVDAYNSEHPLNLVSTDAGVEIAAAMEVEVELADGAKLNPYELLPSSKEFYHYSGSLTTIPCTEGVHWFLFAEPVKISEYDFLLLSRTPFASPDSGHLGMTGAQGDMSGGITVAASNRPIQDLNGRTVYWYPGQSNEASTSSITSAADRSDDTVAHENTVLSGLALAFGICAFVLALIPHFQPRNNFQRKNIEVVDAEV